MIGKKMVEITSTFNWKKNYRMYDTFIVSYLRLEEFQYSMEQSPIEERSLVHAANWVQKDFVYYVDINGIATKYIILDDDEGVA